MVQFLVKVVDNQGRAKKMREKWCRNGAEMVQFWSPRSKVDRGRGGQSLVTSSATIGGRCFHTFQLSGL